MPRQPLDYQHMLTTREVARMFRVNTHTVARWVTEGIIPAEVIGKTPGGQLRYRESALLALRDQERP